MPSKKVPNHIQKSLSNMSSKESDSDSSSPNSDFLPSTLERLLRDKSVDWRDFSEQDLCSILERYQGKYTSVISRLTELAEVDKNTKKERKRLQEEKELLFARIAQLESLILDNGHLEIDNSRSPNDWSLPRFVLGFRYLLPRRQREEFAGDIYEIYRDLSESGRSRVGIWSALMLNLCTILYAFFWFKINSFFKTR